MVNQVRTFLSGDHFLICFSKVIHIFKSSQRIEMYYILSQNQPVYTEKER